METEELQRLWQEWLRESQIAIKALHEETAAIMLRDIERARAARRTANECLALLRKIDSAALTHAGRLKEKMGGAFDVDSLSRWMDKNDAQAFLGLGNQVKATAQSIQNLLAKNKRLFAAELAPGSPQDPPDRAVVPFG